MNVNDLSLKQGQLSHAFVLTLTNLVIRHSPDPRYYARWPRLAHVALIDRREAHHSPRPDSMASLYFVVSLLLHI